MSKSRKELRQETVDLINGLSRQTLLKEFAISRVAEITGLDTIGIPVYTCVRALSRTISIHAGKGILPSYARAGSILEAIEFEAAENPVGKFLLNRAAAIPEEEHLDLDDAFPARSSILSELTPLAWESMTNIQNGESKLIPSDLIWLVPRVENQPLMYVQMGTNGLAAGAALEDAILSALYEVIERDAWTLSQYLLDTCGIVPTRCPLAGLPPRLESAVRKIEAAKLRLHLFDITTDYSVPVFSAILIDRSGNCAGTFGGYGCHINAEIAAIRAVTEAVQGRCCYISGARDDMFRRQFLLMKRMDQERLDQMFSELPMGGPLPEYRVVNFPNVQHELRYVLRLIKQHGVSQVFAKELGSFLDDRIKVVRVFTPQCEPFRFDHWTPGLRCLTYVKRRLDALSKITEPKVTEEEDEEGEAWKNS